MSYVSRYFKPTEFSCRCGCGENDVSTELLQVLDALREYLGVPVTITSGKRCVKHNKAVGGASKSKHLEGVAADVQAKGVSPAVVHKYFEAVYPNKYGLGRYNSFTHIDVRPNKARW